MKDKEACALRLAKTGRLVGELAGAMGMDLQQFYRYRRKHPGFDAKIRGVIKGRTRRRRKRQPSSDPLFTGDAPSSQSEVERRAAVLQTLRTSALVQRKAGGIL